MNKLNLKTIKVNEKVIPVSDSREVDLKTGKEHSKLLRDIRGYIEHLNEANFGLVDFFIEDTYLDSKGEERPCYQLTKQGCEMVANKMTGKKGTLFTATYVQAFNKMEETIKNKEERQTIEGLSNIIEDMKGTIEEYKSMCKITCSKKRNYTDYIKKALGINKANHEYERVKSRIFLVLGVKKWEDIDFETSKDIVSLIDESVNKAKQDRPYKQMSYFEE